MEEKECDTTVFIMTTQQSIIVLGPFNSSVCPSAFFFVGTEDDDR